MNTKTKRVLIALSIALLATSAFLSIVKVGSVRAQSGLLFSDDFDTLQPNSQLTLGDVDFLNNSVYVSPTHSLEITQSPPYSYAVFNQTTGPLYIQLFYQTNATSQDHASIFRLTSENGNWIDIYQQQNQGVTFDWDNGINVTNIYLTPDAWYNFTLSLYLDPTHGTNSSAILWLNQTIIVQQNMPLIDAYDIDQIQFPNSNTAINYYDDIIVSNQPISSSMPSSVLDHFVFNSIGTQTAGTLFGVTIKAVDSSGNTVTTYSGIPTLSYSAGSINPHSTTGGFSNGVWTSLANVTATGSGVTLEVNDANGHSGASNSFSVSSAIATNFLVSGYPNPTTAGVAATIDVTAKDQYGNVVTNYVGTVAITSSDAKAILPTDTSLINGVGSFSFTLRTAGSQSITATDQSSRSIAGSQTLITVNPSTLSAFNFSTVGTQTAGSAFNVSVTAVDAYGNTVPGYTGSPSLTVSAGSISPNTMNSFVSGVGSTSTIITNSGSGVTIIATDGTHSGTKNSFTLNPAQIPSSTAIPTITPTPTLIPASSPSITPMPLPTLTPTPSISQTNTQTPHSSPVPILSSEFLVYITLSVFIIAILLALLFYWKFKGKTGK